MAVLKRVAIKGFIPDSLADFAPYKKRHPEAEVWGFNSSEMLERERYDRWYELHAEHKLAEDWDHLERAKCRVVMQRHFDRVPRSEAYPLDAAKKLLVYPYITNSITMIVAQAILDGFGEIALFGIDMAIRMGDGPSEVSEQRPSVEYVLGIAIGRGINVIVPDACDLLKTNVVYGYEEHVDSLITRARRRREQLEKVLRYHQGSADIYRGALEELESFTSRWLVSAEEPGVKG